MPSSPLDVVDWTVASRVAKWSASRKVQSDAYRSDAVAKDFEELTAQAEVLVAAATGLQPLSGPARAKVVDRSEWANVNVASMQRLLAPALAKAAERRDLGNRAWMPEWFPRTVKVAGRSVAGVELGMVLGFLSTRVLGQYDLLLTEEAVEDQDLVYYVGPNVVELEQRHGFDPRQFRLWLALHEVTHRCQFTAVPWLRDHFVKLVDESLEMIAADPRQLAQAIRRAATTVRSGGRPLDEVGLLGLIATPQQLDALHRIQALMSLLEGHGDSTMARAGAAQVPDAATFARVLRERRQQTTGPARLLQRLLGLEAKARQYEEGERFIAAVESAGGVELFDTVWKGPELLPSLSEIRNPGDWIRRVSPAPIAG